MWMRPLAGGQLEGVTLVGMRRTGGCASAAPLLPRLEMGMEMELGRKHEAGGLAPIPVTRACSRRTQWVCSRGSASWIGLW